jgi:hypothetical protein
MKLAILISSRDSTIISIVQLWDFRDVIIKLVFFYNLIFGHQPAEVKFDIRSADLFDKSLSSATILSLAYHHGYLTYSKDVESKLVCPNLELKRILLEGFARGNHKAIPIVNEILRADELSDKNTRNKLFADFIDLVLKTAPTTAMSSGSSFDQQYMTRANMIDSACR